MNTLLPLDRRTFLADLGRGAFALAIFGVAGCSPAAVASAGAGAGASESASGSAPPSGGGAGVTWERVNLGFVSTYILVRGTEAAIVDTGLSSSADKIEASLSGVGLDWSAVGHLILTHYHDDHVGSAADVMDRAPGAMAYAGSEDIPAIAVPRPLTAVRDGDEVFGLRIVASPGHTAGHISVFDPVGGILVAGDAMGTSGGKPVLPDAQFTADMTQAKASVVKLGGLTFEALLVGHGDPIESGASGAVVELGAAG